MSRNSLGGRKQGNIKFQIPDFKLKIRNLEIGYILKSEIMLQINHDRLFKELLTTFFVEFIELFFPDIIDYLEADSLEFIDKEIFTDITTGARREADLLVKCRFQGRATFFLIHLENQSKREKDFAKRMFFYFARLTEKFALPVYPIALFSHDKPRTAEKSQYIVDFPHRKVVEFNFAVIQLNRLDWRDFISRDNPAASALMAKMGIENADRVTAKKECLRMIARLKLDPARTHLLGGFVDSYIKLLDAERKKLDAEVKKLPPKERGEIMEITTSWEEKGLQLGLQQGLRRETELVLRQIKKKFGNLKKFKETQILALPIEQVEELGEALLDFEDAADLDSWLNRVSQNN